MRVLSLFDGMSCGQIALRELGVSIETYYASEIDKFAIQQTQHNFPDTVQLGDVTKIDTSTLPKIDLLLGGSPCQGFSFAGKQLNFNDPRSKLFFDFVRIWKELKAINPDIKYLFENVNMKKRHMAVINDHLEIRPVRINSNLVSAQNRDRWYWSDIKTAREGLFQDLVTDFAQPEDRGIYLKDILQPEHKIDEKYYISSKAILRMMKKKYSAPKINPQKTGCLSQKNNSAQCAFDSGTTLIKMDRKGNVKPDQRKSSALSVGGHGCGNHSDMDIICVAMRGRDTSDGKTQQQLEPNSTGKTNCLTSVPKDNLIYQRPHGNNNGGVRAENGKTPAMTSSSWEHNNLIQVGHIGNVNSAGNRVYSMESDKCRTLTDGGGGGAKMGLWQTGDYRLRRLTPLECSRLQTIPAWYEWVVSDSQAYRCLGNGWTVEVIKHFLEEMTHSKT